MKSRIDDEVLRNLYNQGKLHREIADFFGCATCTITARLDKMGFRKPRVDKEKMRQLHEEGLMDAEIAKILGCTRSNVTVYLNRMGYTNRRSKMSNIELRDRLSQALIGRFTGSSNPNYRGKGNIKKLARGLCKTLSRRVMRKRNFTCQNCGRMYENMETHHIKPFRLILDDFVKNVYDGNLDTLYDQLMSFDEFTDENNLVVLCHECHRRVHYTDDHELSPLRWKSATTIESADKSLLSESE